MVKTHILLGLSAALSCLANAKSADHVSRGGLHIRDLIPEGIPEINQDYELVHFDERLDEDAIYITKGASSCGDCNWFTPWPEDTTPSPSNVLQRDALYSIDLGDNTTETQQLVSHHHQSRYKVSALDR
jgi:hypothetical protein